MGSINNRPLKAYVRYDGSGRVIAGSLVLRRSIPKVGKWQEVQGYECCNEDQLTLTVTVSGLYPIISVDIAVQSNEVNVYLFTATGQNAADVHALAALLNTHASQYGFFKVNSAGDLLLEVSYNLASVFKAAGSLTLQATTFAD